MSEFSNQPGNRLSRRKFLIGVNGEPRERRASPGRVPTSPSPRPDSETREPASGTNRCLPRCSSLGSSRKACRSKR